MSGDAVQPDASFEVKGCVERPPRAGRASPGAVRNTHRKHGGCIHNTIN